MKRLLIFIISLACLHISAVAQLTDQQQIQKLNLVYQHLRNNYVDDVPLEHLVEEAVIATLRELDPHSSYLNREQMAALNTRISGEFAGVGIQYVIHRDTVVVRGTIANSPAERAKICVNDRIISIDSKPIIGIPTDSIPALLRGTPNTKVDIGVVRRGEGKPLTITLKRDYIESSAISASARFGDIGYIAASAFSKPLAAEFYAAYKSLGDIKSLVVDLRDNSGGAITSAIDLTGLFLKKGDVIVSTEGRNSNVVYDKKRDGAVLDIPVVVLINENSASASEIFAGAIQDHDRGIIVGHTSYGKGLIQRVIDFKDGTGMCLTVARYKTPSGRVIQRPYTMGEGERYTQDTMRYLHPDSVSRDSNLLFKTLKRGREVYGGGGITPDVYISQKEGIITELVHIAIISGAFTHTAIDIIDTTSIRDIKQKYHSIEEFDKHYTLDDSTYVLLCKWIEATGYNISEHQRTSDREMLTTLLKATIGDIVYGDGAYQYIYNRRYDTQLIEAINIAGNTERQQAILGL